MTGATESCPCCAAALGESSFAGVDRNHGIAGDFEVAVCAECGAGRTRPFVEEGQLGALYPAAYAPYDLPTGAAGLASRLIRRWQGRQALRSAPIEALADREPGRVLDVGCGRGDLGETLIGEGWRVDGIEPSPEACAVASARGICAREGTLATVELEPGAYDAISFKHSLEHVSDPLAALARAREGLCEGGLVAVSVPNFGSWQARRFRSCWYHLDLPRHRTHFTPDGLTRLLERAELHSVEIVTSSSTMGLPFSVQYRLAGRSLVPSGLALRVALLACLAVYPLAWALDRARGGGDFLHAVARR